MSSVSAIQTTPQMECKICNTTRSNLPYMILETGGGHFTKSVCRHPFCSDCAKAWIHSAVQDNQRHVRCPEEGCTNFLYADDVRRLGSRADYDLYMTRLKQDFSARLRESGALDKDFVEFLNREAKTCPECRVVLVRSDGCNMMRCTCGTNFCYGCARKECWCCSHCPYTNGEPKTDHDPAKCPNRVCYRCKRTGHDADKCPTKCDTCGRRGHTADRCTTECLFCHERGHLASRCPARICDGCGRSGHDTDGCRTVCRQCAAVGHGVDRCPKTICKRCARGGHTQHRCPLIVSTVPHVYEVEFPLLGQPPKHAAVAVDPSHQQAGKDLAPPTQNLVKTIATTPMMRTPVDTTAPAAKSRQSVKLGAFAALTIDDDDDDDEAVEEETVPNPTQPPATPVSRTFQRVPWNRQHEQRAARAISTRA